MTPDQIEQHDPFDIDPRKLDVEWRDQIKLSRAAGRRHGTARLAYNRAKTHAELQWSRLYLMARNTPATFGLRDKPTVDEIEAAVTVHNDYQSAVDEMHRAEKALDDARADVTAYVDRRKALEDTVNLLALNYHTEKDPRAKYAGSPESPGVDFDPTESEKE